LKISGKFEVKLQPLEPYTKGAKGIQIGRMSIDKTFSGELDAVSKGEMISAAGAVIGSAGYVAVEQVEGTLSGKKGSFALQHFATMSNKGFNLLIEVVPDSGIGELKNISGKMSVRIEDKQHYYDFEYEL
jgi:Protein of unknown function (DUF3224)